MTEKQLQALRKSMRIYTITLAVALLALAGGVAYATIPDASGVISACYGNNGNLRVIDAEAGHTCRSGETALNWNQGGGALAYARVNPDGSFDHDSGNISVENPFPGIYCIGVAGGTPRVAIANLDSQRNVGGSVQTGVFSATDCAAFPDANQIFVVTRGHNQDGGLPGTNRGFYIVIN